ncbi:MAG: nucleotidyltransferase family protein [Actinomycetota bacterium]
MPIDGVLLAAGRGERLRPLTDVLAKPAIPLLDIPLGAWGLTAVREAARSVVVNVSDLGERIVGALAPYGDFEVLDEGAEPFGTAGTLLALRDRLAPTFVTMSADVLTNLAPAILLEAHRRRGAAMTVAMRSVERGADLRTEAGAVTGFVDRRVEADAPGGLFLNLAAIELSALEVLPDRRPLGLGESLLKPLAERGDVAVHPSDDYWLDVGTIERYLQAGADLLEGRGPPPPRPHPGEFVDLPHGRAYVGSEVGIDEDSLGPGAVVLEGAQVQMGAYVERAVVWPDEVVPAGTRLRECVWAAGAAHRPAASE